MRQSHGDGPPGGRSRPSQGRSRAPPRERRRAPARRRSHCGLYSDCPMRMSAMVWAGMGGVVWGTSIEQLRRFGINQILIPATTVIGASAFYDGEIRATSCSPKPTHCSGTASVLSALDRRCHQKWHSNKVLAPPTRLGRSTNTPAASGSPQQRTIARTTRKSGEYRRIRGRTYCPGATIRASIWGIPIDVSRIDCMSGAVQARAQTELLELLPPETASILAERR